MSNRWRYSLVTAVVVLICGMGISQLLTIDWDLGQRRRQKTAFLRARTLRSALEEYKRKNGGYPKTLEQIQDEFVRNVATNGTDFAESEWRGTVDASAVRVWGYEYKYDAFRPAPEDLAFEHYELHVDPIRRGSTGFESFYISDGGAVRWNDQGVANASDPEPDIDPALDMHSYWAYKVSGIVRR
jgi:hypothetical protein